MSNQRHHRRVQNRGVQPHERKTTSIFGSVYVIGSVRARCLCPDPKPSPGRSASERESECLALPSTRWAQAGDRRPRHLKKGSRVPFQEVRLKYATIKYLADDYHPSVLPHAEDSTLRPEGLAIGTKTCSSPRRSTTARYNHPYLGAKRWCLWLSQDPR